MSSEEDLRKSVLFTQPAASHAQRLRRPAHDVLTDLLDKVAPVRTRRRRPQKPVSR